VPQKINRPEIFGVRVKRRGKTLLGAVFDVNNPMKVGEEPVGIPAGERDSGRANPRSEPCRSRDS
jgi:hypothetical protein